MSLYSEYLDEIGNKEIVEHEHGFATFSVNGPECYIDDIYVRSEHRRSHVGSRSAAEVIERAKAKGCTYLLGTVHMKIKDPSSSAKALLGYGFKLVKSNESMLFFTKELK